jgi:hypothetical protein
MHSNNFIKLNRAHNTTFRRIPGLTTRNSAQRYRPTMERCVFEYPKKPRIKLGIKLLADVDYP